MFISYNLEEFGQNLKNIRKKMGISQTDIQSHYGISADTLRRIEQGQVIPRYDTLELLSVIYKQDLLELLKKNRSNKLLMEFHNSLDEIISSYKTDAFNTLEADFQNTISSIPKTSLLNLSEVEQFKLFLKAIKIFNSRNEQEIPNAFPILMESLKITIPSFSLKNFHKVKYNYLESRILLLLSLILIETNQYEVSNSIMEFLLKDFLEESERTKHVHHLIAKIYTNLAYNHHMLDRHTDVIIAANKGIDYCIKEEITHGLFLLYYRKGIAQLQLGDDQYLESLKAAIFILKLHNKNELLEIYKKVTKDKYGVEL